ncbi:MAG: amino acid ABC transporter permease [Deltaproteobacteria bacterium]|nr:amino acid ABC transporter permease [Deltaproteobacteria bacterium]MBW2072384.1 amino acid ABC transporter permease [Deltaproteobacteria bacterium]
MTELLYIQQEMLPALLRGLWVSVKLIVPSAFGGLLLGVLVACLRVYGNSFVRTVARTYVVLFRGIPLLVQLFIWYFGLPHLGVYLSPYAASVVGFTMCSGAYHSEYIRGALLSIRSGQMHAAQALGFSTRQTVWSIILPQAIRRALPGCGNEIIYLIKYSSLAYMVTCIELTGEGKILASHSFKYTEVFLVVGIFYLFMVSIAGRILAQVEDSLSVPGFERHRL